jgi:nucleoside-diphosphate-sugar epimerase
LIHVSDLVELLLRAAARGSRVRPAEYLSGTGEGYYFACAPEYPDFAEFGRMLRRALGRRHAPVIFAPEPLPWLIAGANELVARITGKSTLFNVDKIREALVESWACSSRAAEHDLDFHPPLRLAERLKSTAQWYREQGWL